MAGIVVMLLSLPFSIRDVEAQQLGISNFEEYTLPKDMRPLDFDWFDKGDMRDLGFLRMPGLTPDYRLGAGDVLQVTVVGFEQPFLFTIEPGGTVTMPLVGDVRVVDLTAEEAENAIADRLREEQLVKDPEVLVYIQDYESKRFWVTGQVDRPGEYAMSQELTVMDAIFMSGGLDFYGEPFLYLHRRLDGTGGSAPTRTTAEHPETAAPGTEVFKIDLTSMRAGGVLVPNPPLRDGDVLVVPTRYPMVFYVLGDVGSPGAFTSNTGQRLTVAQAVATAGGLTRTAKGKEARLIRYTADGEPEERPFDYRSILEGESPDFAIEPNDVIFIPGKSVDLADSVMRWVPGLAFRYPIWR